MKSTELKRTWSLPFSVVVAALATLLVLSLSVTSSNAEDGLLAQEGSVPCLDTNDTLEDLVYCIYDYMPHRFSVDDRDGFDVPTAAELAQWRAVVEQMMNGECDTIDLGQYDWGDDFTVTTFADLENGNTYCVFMETSYEAYPDPIGSRVTHGWGTFIYNPAYLRELNISAPHVKYEAWTDLEATAIFKRTRSRTLLMTGAHRYASDVDSGCQPDRKRSDAAHNVDHMFHAAVAELMEYYDTHNATFHHLQFHGMGTSSCPGVDVYVTHGSATAPVAGDKILELQTNLVYHNPTWTVTVPGHSPACILNGTTNVQGRLINGVATDQVCGTVAAGYSGHFIHIEQHKAYRDANYWFAAVNDTWSVRVYYFPLMASSSIAFTQ